MAQVVGLPKVRGARITPHSAGGPGEQRQIVRLAGWVTPYERVMLAPLAASLLRYGACLLRITPERCLFSKITTTMWSGRGADAFGFLCAGRRAIAVGVMEADSSTALVFVGSAGTTVGKLLEGAAALVDDGSATAQAADANSKITAAAQPNRGKARTCT